MTKYTPELFDAVCSEISFTDKSLEFICKKLDIHRASVYNWINDDKILFDKYTRAKEMQAHHLAGQTIEIADETSDDYITNKFGEEVTNNEAIARSRLKIDARKWLAGKLHQKVYGDKVSTELSVTEPSSFELKITRVDSGSKPQ